MMRLPEFTCIIVPHGLKSLQGDLYQCQAPLNWRKGCGGKIFPMLFYTVVLRFHNLQFPLLLHCSPEILKSNLYWFIVVHLLFFLFLWGMQVLGPPNAPSCWCHLSLIPCQSDWRHKSLSPAIVLHQSSFLHNWYNWFVCTRSSTFSWVIAPTNQYKHTV